MCLDTVLCVLDTVLCVLNTVLCVLDSFVCLDTVLCVWIQYCIVDGNEGFIPLFAFAGLRTLRNAPLLPALRPSNLIALLRYAATNYVALRSKSMAVALINFTTVPSLSVPMVVANVLWRQEQISLPFCQALSFTGPIFSNQDFSPFRIFSR